MDTKTVVFALVLGWLAGDQGVPPTLVDWLTTRETIGKTAGAATCTLAENVFELRQVLLDERTARP